MSHTDFWEMYLSVKGSCVNLDSDSFNQDEKKDLFLI